MKRAFIIGAFGQDGTYLSRHLLQRGYELIQVGRNRTLSTSQKSVAHVDLCDSKSIGRALKEFEPHEIYYLAAYHHSSQEQNLNTPHIIQTSFDVHVHGLGSVLEKMCEFDLQSRLFYGASSHVFGVTQSASQNEATPFNPQCVYGITKSLGTHLCRYFRRKKKIFASVGILYNHESELRSSNFVSQKIVRGAVAISRGRLKKLVLGNLDARIDWGFAGDYVSAMHTILQLPKADDFVIATNQTHSVRDFVRQTFSILGLDYRRYVEVDRHLVRPQNGVLKGDSSKLKRLSQWRVTVSFPKLIQFLVSKELARRE